MTKHPFHLVDTRPWPLFSAWGTFLLVRGLVTWIHQYDARTFLWKCGLLMILLTSFQWWRDVWREATFQGKHTSAVEGGLRIGMILFIMSEVFFFFSFFWAFFHSSLRPNTDLGQLWPPIRIQTVDPFGVPLLNTVVLISRGATITWTHMSLLSSETLEARISFAVTVILGISFTSLQYIEYKYCSFSISDSVFGRTFYVATGFHGLHVMIGTLFIVFSWWRHANGHFTGCHHFGFEASAWYWHFVDVVWLFLFVSIYWWSY